MSELKVAERWATYEHECPFCGMVQSDMATPDKSEWFCEECGEKYILPVVL